MPEPTDIHFGLEPQARQTRDGDDDASLLIHSIAISLKRIADSMEREEGVRFERSPDLLHNPSWQTDDGWIPWSGGACPVAPETVVEVRFRDYVELSGPASSWCYDGRHIDNWQRDPSEPDADIIAYRVVSN